MRFVYNDGGRAKYFKAAGVGDCVARAVAIATGRDYKEVYDEINAFAKTERRHKSGYRTNARNGVRKDTARRYVKSLGWTWIPTMQVGAGCKVHLCEEELPSGTLIVKVSHHYTCVKDGVLYDTYDCSRDEGRCVYGYFVKA